MNDFLAEIEREVREEGERRAAIRGECGLEPGMVRAITPLVPRPTGRAQWARTSAAGVTAQRTIPSGALRPERFSPAPHETLARDEVQSSAGT